MGRLMGRWKIRQLHKGQRASKTRSSKARKYLAIPPADIYRKITKLPKIKYAK